MQNIHKTQSSRFIKHASLLLGLSLCLLGATHLKAASGTWTNDVLEGLWSDSVNWLDGIIADGSGDTATFSNELASSVLVDMDSSRTLGNLTFIQGTYIISNNAVDANVLTLAGPSKPVINIPVGQAQTIRRTVVAGTDGFVLDGGGTLNLFKENTNANNTITGEVVLSNGVLQVQGILDGDNLANTPAVGSISSFRFINGTLNLRPGANTTPEYGNVNGNLIVPEGGVGTLILPPRWSGAAGDNSAGLGAGLGGTLTGSGTLNVDTMYVRSAIVGDWSAFSGQLNIVRNGGPAAEDKQFRVGFPAGLPNASVDLGGANDFGFFYYRNLTATTVYPIGVLTGNNPLATLRGSATAGQTLVYDIGAKHTNSTDIATFAGGIVNGAGPAGIVKRGAGTLILTGDNTYTGPTTVSNGVLQIGDSFNDAGSIGGGPITNMTAIIFARAGLLNVQGGITGPGGVTNIGLGGTLRLAGVNTYTGPTAVLTGRLLLGTGSRLTNSVTVTDTAGFGAIMLSANGTATIGSLALGFGSTFDVEFGNFANPTPAVVTNLGDISLSGDVTVNITGPNIAVGTITLLQYNGNRSGVGNFVLGTLPPHVTVASINDDTVNKRVTLTITTTFDDTLLWVGDANGVWDAGNPANLVWREIGSGLLTNYYDGAKVLFDDSATGATTIDISLPVFPSKVTVNNSSLSYTFSGFAGVSGTTTLTKRGTGTLTMINPNDYAGLTEIQEGTIQLGDGVTDGNIGTGPITNNATLLVNRVTPMTMPNVITGSGNVVQAGTLGMLTLSGANTYAGGLTLRPGTTLGYNNGSAAGNGGGLRMETDSTVVLGADIAAVIGNVVVITNGTFRNTGANRVIDAPINATNVTITFDKTPNIITINRTMANISGVITNIGTGLLRFNSGGGNNSVGSASALWVLDTAGGFLQPRNTSVNFLGGLQGVGTISASQSSTPTLTTWVIGDLNLDTEFSGVINDGSAFNQFGRFTAITKVGTGTLVLSDASVAHRSLTVVSNGTLSLAGSTEITMSTNVTVAAPGIVRVVERIDGTLTLGAGTTNQTLRGDGTVQGNVVLGANGRLEPGFSTGTLTVSGSVTLGGTSVMEVSTAPGLSTSDQLAAASITYGGTLILTNIGSVVGSNTFQLFNGSLSGTFSSVVTPTMPNVTWDTSQLNVNGTVTVIGASLVPTNITAVVVDDTLNLSWPSSHIGWRLETQTNPINVGLSDNWVPVAGSTFTNLMSFPIAQTNETVFYRLTIP